jgi:glycosyltransferase involved in cell wall biosynthesis
MESGGFDFKLVRGGISVYLWNLARSFRARGRRVSVLSALNGQRDYLAEVHGLAALDYRDRWTCRLDADPAIWGDRMAAPFELDTRAYHLEKDGIDFYYLGNDLLDRYPDTYYPPYEGKGSDPGFFKPLVFQIEAARFIARHFADEPLLIHAHEPFYQYLLPSVFADDPTKRVVSTVQSNMPISKKVYVPETRSALAMAGGDPARVAPDAPLADTAFNRCLRAYLPRTHLFYDYPADYLSLFDLVLADSDGVDFLSEGHRRFYTGFHGTAFRALFVQMPVAAAYRDHAGKLFVGGCAIGDRWRGAAPATPAERAATLAALGLDPALPAFFHSARYAPNHKGQVELILAIRRFLEAGGEASFIVRCITEAPIADVRFAALASDFPGRVHLDTAMQPEAALHAMAAAADFALFPSKFEMDTYLIAQGEAMAVGCVPVAADQLGMAHWAHGRGAADPAERTGLSVIRSFLEEDPALVDSLVVAIGDAATLYADAPRYAEMAARARALAMRHDWQAVGDAHLAAFDALDTAAPPLAATAPDPADWRAVAWGRGQVVDLRAAGDATLPLLERRGDRLFHAAGPAAVNAFVERGSGFDEVPLRREASGDGFAATIGDGGAAVFVLVTEASGDQYWDGLVPPAGAATWTA